mgnify:CR=1 FL=1
MASWVRGRTCIEREAREVRDGWQVPMVTAVVMLLLFGVGVAEAAKDKVIHPKDGGSRVECPNGDKPRIGFEPDRVYLVACPRGRI